MLRWWRRWRERRTCKKHGHIVKSWGSRGIGLIMCKRCGEAVKTIRGQPR